MSISSSKNIRVTGDEKLEILVELLLAVWEFMKIKTGDGSRTAY